MCTLKIVVVTFFRRKKTFQITKQAKERKENFLQFFVGWPQDSRVKKKKGRKKKMTPKSHILTNLEWAQTKYYTYLVLVKILWNWCVPNTQTEMCLCGCACVPVPEYNKPLGILYDRMLNVFEFFLFARLICLVELLDQSTAFFLARSFTLLSLHTACASLSKYLF